MKGRKQRRLSALLFCSFVLTGGSRPALRSAIQGLALGSVLLDFGNHVVNEPKHPADFTIRAFIGRGRRRAGALLFCGLAG